MEQKTKIVLIVLGVFIVFALFLNIFQRKNPEQSFFSINVPEIIYYDKPKPVERITNKNLNTNQNANQNTNTQNNETTDSIVLTSQDNKDQVIEFYKRELGEDVQTSQDQTKTILTIPEKTVKIWTENNQTYISITTTSADSL